MKDVAQNTDMERFLSMCLSLTAERDREALLSSILDAAMDVARCDAGTLYLLEEDGLHFRRMVTRSQNVRQGGHDAPIALPPVPLDPAYVCSWVALHNAPINVPDVRRDDHFDFTGSLRYDAMTGYHTRSMLVVPMGNDKGEVIGVAQLINALDDTGRVIPFDHSIQLLVSALSSLAAISATNMLYAEQITLLLDSVVETLSTAIDERSHYTANHTRNMVRYGEAFLDWLERTGNPWTFDETKRRTFLMSVWLHDVGKLAVPLRVMDKVDRLGMHLEPVRQRLRTAGLLDRIACLEGRMEEAARARRDHERAEALSLIERVNKAGFLSEEDLAAVSALSGRTFTDENGRTQPWLTEEEILCLSIRKGTLTQAERAVIQGHAAVTGRILRHVQFPRMYAQVPRWAAAHHELLNGTGYPEHLSDGEIPREVRLLTILDVFEALTAKDRPYKPAIPLERSLGILHAMAAEGAIDAEILALFEQSRAWEGNNG